MPYHYLQKLLLMRYFLFFLLPLLTGCSVANLRTDAMAGQSDQALEERGRALLDESVRAMGLDKLMATKTYSMTTNFDWSTGWSMMPMNALPGNKNKDLRFRFATNSFDGQLEWLEGPRTGEIRGVQSFVAYEREAAEAPATEIGSNRYPWGLTAYHYIMESPARILQSAPIIRYAGQREFDGVNYDLVYATWGNGDQRKDYDQYLLYINPTTHFVDLSEITITDFFLPMPNGMKNATVRYPERVLTSIGAYLPTVNVIQFGKPKEKITKDVYTFTYRDFAFDNFDAEALYPLEGLERYGDSKPAE